ncbi:hypothetical protein, partial [Escherichia coli]|uniref:hypothetical protein n=1 Tax=Escherichia coli TaxID=562 RepID=UPI00359410DC
YALSKNIEAFEAILVLLIYGLFLFQTANDFVDANAINLFLIKNLVPTLLDDTYFTIHRRNRYGVGRIECCTVLLHEWFISHLPKISALW